MAPPSKDLRSGTMEGSVFRVAPYHYLHVLDQTTNVTRLETGPVTFVRKDNEQVLLGPERMLTVPPRHYCVVKNPIMRDAEGQVLRDAMGQVRLGMDETFVGNNWVQTVSCKNCIYCKD